MKVLLNSFHLNGHTVWFHPQSKVQLHLLTQCLTLGVKGLIPDCEHKRESPHM